MKKINVRAEFHYIDGKVMGSKIYFQTHELLALETLLSAAFKEEKENPSLRRAWNKISHTLYQIEEEKLKEENGGNNEAKKS